MIKLEEATQEAFLNINLKKEAKNIIETGLNQIRIKDEQTWKHSMQVGLKSLEVAKYLEINPTKIITAGFLHDIGKILISPQVLNRKYNFPKEYLLEMRKHPTYSFKILKGIDNFAAGVSYFHHTNQDNPYPRISKKLMRDYSQKELEEIKSIAKKLSIVDYYVASKRKNNRNGNCILTPTKRKNNIVTERSYATDLILELYKEKIFK